ncbi:MAG: NADH-quinone oxidoreductase subunit, partial [Acidimicrobiaceae bacterium]
DILINAWDKNALLYVVGALTALLTAFYMGRQVFMVFFGKERFEHEGEHAVHPHESPWTMTLPLVVLAVLATVGGALNLPFSTDSQLLGKWLAPVVEGNERVFDIAGQQQVIMALAVGVLAAVMIFLAKRVYLDGKGDPAKIELPVLAHAWHYDEAISAFVGGPGEEAFEGVAAFDRGVVDGAVNGVGTLVQLSSRELRKTQTGYVRNYALGVALGAVVLVGLLLIRVTV